MLAGGPPSLHTEPAKVRFFSPLAASPLLADCCCPSCSSAGCHRHASYVAAAAGPCGHANVEIYWGRSLIWPTCRCRRPALQSVGRFAENWGNVQRGARRHVRQDEDALRLAFRLHWTLRYARPASHWCHISRPPPRRPPLRRLRSCRPVSPRLYQSK